MNALNTLELKLADLYAKLPNLPQNARRWIAVNAWWIILIIAIISSLAVLIAIPSLFVIAGSSAYSAIYTNMSVPLGQLLTSAVVNVIIGFIGVVLLWMAVSPLKALRHRGWKLLFAYQLVSAIAALAAFVLVIQGFHIFSLIASLLMIAVELYFLYQVRGEFSNRAAVAKEAEVVTATVVKKKTVKK